MRVSRFYPADCRRRSIAAGLMILGAIPLTASAELYKYVNEQGVTVLDSHVPARYVKNGYSILSNSGRLIEVVPRAPTEAELAELERQKALDEAAAKLASEREAADENLMRLYRTPEDLQRARVTQVESVEVAIDAGESNLVRLQDQKRDLEAELAGIERAGGQVGQSRIDQMHDIERRIEQTQVAIEHRRQELIDVNNTFTADLKRLRQLYGLPEETAVRSEDR